MGTFPINPDEIYKIEKINSFPIVTAATDHSNSQTKFNNTVLISGSSANQLHVKSNGSPMMEVSAYGITYDVLELRQFSGHTGAAGTSQGCAVKFTRYDGSAHIRYNIGQDANSNFIINKSGVNMTDNIFFSMDDSTGVMTGDFNDTSDIRFKKDIVELKVNNILNDFKKLRPVDFCWKKKNRPSKGFIAQDVEKIFPELVNITSDTPEGHKSINTVGIVSILTKVVQEQQKTIDELLIRLDNLENK
jgi:hypothetical protein